MIPITICVLGAQAWKSRVRLYDVLVLILLVVLLLLYMRGQSGVGVHHDKLYAFKHPLSAAIYIACFLGNPFFLRLSSITGYAAAGMGAGFLCLSAWLVVRKQVSPIGRTGRLVSAAILLAALVCMGRLEFGIGQSLSSRYVTCVSFAWVALIGTISNAYPAQRWTRWAVLLILALGFCSSLSNLRYKLYRHEPQVRVGQQCLNRFLTGKLETEKEECLLNMYYSVPRVKQLALELQRLGLLHSR